MESGMKENKMPGVIGRAARPRGGTPDGLCPLPPAQDTHVRCNLINMLGCLHVLTPGDNGGGTVLGRFRGRGAAETVSPAGAFRHARSAWSARSGRFTKSNQALARLRLLPALIPRELPSPRCFNRSEHQRPKGTLSRLIHLRFSEETRLI